MLLSLLIAFAHATEEGEVSFGLFDMFMHATWIGKSVIIILLLMLLGTLIVAGERLWAFSRARSRSMLVAEEILNSLRAGDISAALALTKDERFNGAYLAAILQAGLTQLEEDCSSFGISNARRAVDKAIGEELSKLKKGTTILATTGSTAPFVGLFGTTFGVIEAFDGMATEGSGLSAISAGISEALITTGVGIGVAVAGVWIFNYFNHRVEKVANELASSEADFIDWAEKLVHVSQKQAGK